MKHPDRAEDYLTHILDAIRRVETYIQPIPNFMSLKDNIQAQDAISHNIRNIGEAANNVARQDPSLVKDHPEIAWDDIRGMRNRITHEYFNVRLDVLYATAKEDLPRLKEQVSALLKELEQEKQPQQLDLEDGFERERSLNEDDPRYG